MMPAVVGMAVADMVETQLLPDVLPELLLLGALPELSEQVLLLAEAEAEVELKSTVLLPVVVLMEMLVFQLSHLHSFSLLPIRQLLVREPPYLLFLFFLDTGSAIYGH